MTGPAFLLDTNICIYLLEGTAPFAVARLIQFIPGAVGISTITLAELLVQRPRTASEGSALAALLEAVPERAFDRAAANAYAALPPKRARFDRLIAAHALALGATLVTNNERDFADIPSLRTENWARA